MPVYRIPRVEGVTTKPVEAFTAGETVRWTAALLQPWSKAAVAGSAGAAAWKVTCRLRVTATRSATARMSAPTAAMSWRRSGAFEMVRGVVADIGFSSGTGRAPCGAVATGVV